MAKEPYTLIIGVGLLLRPERNEEVTFKIRALIDNRIKTKEEIDALSLYIRHVANLLYPRPGSYFDSLPYDVTKVRPDTSTTKVIDLHSRHKRFHDRVEATDMTLLEYLYCALLDLYRHSKDEHTYKTRIRTKRRINVD